MRKGQKMLEESKAKLSVTQKARLTPEMRQRISEKLKGVPQPHNSYKRSDETKEKIRQANLGKKVSEETKAKMRAAQQLRRATSKVSEETKAKMSAARMGWSPSEETRAKMSASAKVRQADPERRSVVSEEGRERIRQARLGSKASAETKEKQRQAKLGKPGPWTGKERGPQPQEWRDAICRANVGKKWSAEQRERMSGENSHFYGKTPKHGKRILYNGVWYRLNYEVRFAKALDTLQIPFEYETTRFKLSNGTTYLPDFRVPKLWGKAWVDIKGWFGPDSIRKCAQFRKDYPDIPLIVATLPILKMVEALAKRRLASGSSTA